MPIPTMTPPTKVSTQIKAAGQDGDDLYVEFHGRNGKPSSVYRYWHHGDGKHPTVHLEPLLNGESAGTYFGQHIRGAYPYEKVS